MCVYDSIKHWRVWLGQTQAATCCRLSSTIFELGVDESIENNVSHSGCGRGRGLNSFVRSNFEPAGAKAMAMNSPRLYVDITKHFHAYLIL